MHLYNAAIYSNNFDKLGRVYSRLTPEEQLLRDQNQYFLESYHYVHKEQSVKIMRREGAKIFLDSGAFSALTQGVKIDIGQFCDYIHRNADIIDMVSVLDHIDFANPAEAAKITWHNLEEMHRRGVTNVLPCYHYGEPEDALEYYIERYPYITIGGLVGASTQALQKWLDRIFSRYLTNGDGTLKTKVHLFGVTSLPLMLRYNATSVDSSTWLQSSQFGIVLMPQQGKQIYISDGSPNAKMNLQHYNTVRPLHREAFDREFHAKGLDTERLRTTYMARWAWNVFAYPEFLNVWKAYRGTDSKFFETDPELF